MVGRLEVWLGAEGRAAGTWASTARASPMMTEDEVETFPVGRASYRARFELPGLCA